MENAAEKTTRSLVETLRGVLGQVAEPTAVLRAILEQAVGRTGAQRGLFVEVATGGELTFQVLHGFQPEQLEGEAGRFSRNLFKRVLASGEPVLLASMLDDPYYQGLESVRALQASSVLCTPIRAGRNVAALLHLEHRQPGHFRREHVAMLESLAEVAGPILEVMQTGRETLRERDQLRQSETRYRSEAEESRRQLTSEWSFGRFVGRSEPVRRLEETVRKAAATTFPVLVLGETGTGKSILARILHYSGPRAKGPLVTVFCPSLEKSMVEAELFGHRKGAFTGAVSDRLGKVQAAEGGTLFLDEIGDLPLEIQPKLLRLLQEKTYERVGDPRESVADVRVIAATNRDLEAEVREGRFRQDLYERLNFIPLAVPPLREHTEDIPLLLRHCLDQTDAGRWVVIAPEGERFLESLDFAWPGNVRHLEQLAARLAMEGRPGPFGAGELVQLLGVRDTRAGSGRAAPGGTVADFEAGLPRLLEESERGWLEQALRRYPKLTRGQMAAKLKISESLLYKKLRYYGITSGD
jgi:transcriptional regulator with GAF, ATPase, and Fis domain